MVGSPLRKRAEKYETSLRKSQEQTPLQRLRISPAAVTQSVTRGERLVKENNYHF
jgi:hypothetical protein